MSTATLDENLLPILEKATERVEIRAKDGRFLGVYHPAQPVRTSPCTEEELREIIRNKGECLPLEEVWKRIGAK